MRSFIISLAVVLVLCSTLHAADCAWKASSSGEQLVSYLEANARTEQPECVIAAIERLGALREPSATDVLIKLLDFRQPKARGLDAPRGGSRMEYPAVGALFAIGKGTVQPLLTALKNSEMTEVARTNAIETIMTIYRDDPQEGIRQLKQAALKAEFQEQSIRLEGYAKSALKYCGDLRDRCRAALETTSATPDN